MRQAEAQLQTARTQAELQANMYTPVTASDPNLILYMPLNEAPGTPIHDSFSPAAVFFAPAVTDSREGAKPRPAKTPNASPMN